MLKGGISYMHLDTLPKCNLGRPRWLTGNQRAPIQSLSHLVRNPEYIAELTFAVLAEDIDQLVHLCRIATGYNICRHGNANRVWSKCGVLYCADEAS
jgi:hypothetical protein